MISFIASGAFTKVVGIAKPLAGYREHDESITGVNKSLELTLAGDWLFQVRGFKAGRTLFDSTDGIRLVKQTAKLVTRPVSAIRKQDDAKVSASVRIMEALERNCAGVSRICRTVGETTVGVVSSTAGLKRTCGGICEGSFDGTRREVKETHSLCPHYREVESFTSGAIAPNVTRAGRSLSLSATVRGQPSASA